MTMAALKLSFLAVAKREHEGYRDSEIQEAHHSWCTGLHLDSIGLIRNGRKNERVV